MLSVSKYDQEYVDQCRTRLDVALAKYRALVKTAKKPAVDAFEPEFFANLVVVLDTSFVHRLRGKEGKDGNPLNEVRVLCTSLLQNGGEMLADSTIKMKPATSVLKYEVGDQIALTEEDFVAISKAFFAEIESKYVER
jgi:hypothetical protein